MTLRRQPEEGIAGADDGIGGTIGALGVEERGAATAARAFARPSIVRRGSDSRVGLTT